MVKDLSQSLWIYSKILPYIRCKNSRHGNEHHLQCPFCNEAVTSSHPNTAMRGYYYINEQSYFCHRCREWHTAFELYEKLSGLSRKDLLPEYLDFISKNGKRGMNFSNFLSVSSGDYCGKSDGKADEIEYLPIPDRMRNPLTERGRKYLEGRKTFDSPNLPKYAKFYSATYSSKRFGNKTYEVVVIPWYLNGEVWGYQWRFLDSDIPFPKYGFPKGAGKRIYGIDMVDTSFPYLICCEGLFDSLWVKNGIAIGGKSLTDFQRNMLSERFPNHKIVYAFDNDEHGIEAMLKSGGNRIDSLLLYWKDISGGAKDLNEFAVAGHEKHFFDENNILKRIFSPAQLKMKMANPFA